MKKKLLTILFASGLTAAFAQSPTITSASNFKIGESQVSYIADTVGIVPGNSGANVMWDFSNLTRIASQDSVISSYYAPSSTTHAADFPNANIATNSVNNSAIAYYNISDTKIELQGIVSEVQGITVKQIYSNPQIMYTLPMTYNYTFSDNFAAQYTANSLDIYRNGTSNVLADGYGTLKIGNRTFEDVLRLHNTTQTRDSVNFGMTDVVTIVDLESWVWMTPTKKEPILTISHITSTNSSTGQTSRAKSVSFNSKVQSTSVKEPAKAFLGLNVYPNPTANNCRVTLKTDNKLIANIQVVNQLGQTVKSIENYTCLPGENAIDINMEDISNGVYFLQFQSDKGIFTEKIIRQ